MDNLPPVQEWGWDLGEVGAQGLQLRPPTSPAPLPVDYYRLPWGRGWRNAAPPCLPGEYWEFFLPIKLVSPNMLRHSWAVLHRESVKYERLLRRAICEARGVACWAGLVELQRAPACENVMAIAIERRVPSARQFIQDAVDNLPYSGKPVHDALKRLRVIKNDNAKWLSGNIVRQVVDGDRAVTIVRAWPAGERINVPNQERRGQRRRRAAEPDHGQR